MRVARRADSALKVPTVAMNAAMPVFERAVRSVSSAARAHKYGPPALGVGLLLALPRATDVPVERGIEALWNLVSPVSKT